MRFSNIVLPSNRKFGLFFTIVFILFGLYFFYYGSITLAQLCFSGSGIFLVLSILLPRILFPLNYLWMHVGFLLGLIVSPIVLGFIFYLIFTPTSLLMKIIGRDELRVKLLSRRSYWKTRDSNKIASNHFENQF